MKWFETDLRWEIFGIKSLEDFINTYVVTSKFHAQVPHDIVTAFETVSYLMVHSYYHYPMMDEAMTKALLIMEMAVKIKAKQSSIDLETASNKKGKNFQKKLVALIDEVCEVNGLDFLKPDFGRARELRNSKMHPDRHSLMGAAGMPTGNIMLFINIINFLFMEKKVIEELIERRSQIKENLEIFKNGNFVLEYNNTKILIDIVHYHKYVKFGNKELLMLLVNPVLNNAYQYITEQKFDNPVVIALKEFKVNGLTLEGKDLKGGDVKIETTYKEENIAKFVYFNEELKRVSSTDIAIYNTFRSGKALWKMEGMIYENCWDN
jgi:hypothetical protein